MRFTYESYRQLLRLLKKHKYVVADYESYKNETMVAILRHDIDTSISKAIEFARIEFEEGVSGTYFVLLNTDFYNVNATKSLEELKQLQKYGAKIGLHFDETKYGDVDSNTMSEFILKEKNILELSLGTPINVVSMHRPSKKSLEANYEIPGMINSYSTEFFEQFKYVSDSRRTWREDVESIVETEEFNKLHILTHAFWYDECEKSASECLIDFIKNAGKERYLSLSKNVRDLSEFVNKNEI